MKCEMRWLPISAMRARPECCGLSPIAEDLDDAMRDLIYNVAGRTLKLPVALDADRHDRVEMKLDLVFPKANLFQGRVDESGQIKICWHAVHVH